MPVTLSLNIINSYAKTHEEVASKITHALSDGDIPQAYRQELMKQAYESAYAFVDSVINAGNYTHNEELIKEIQDLFMDKAMIQHDRIFDKFYEHTKVWREVASAKE